MVKKLSLIFLSNTCVITLLLTTSMSNSVFSQEWVAKNTSHFSQEALKKIPFEIKSLAGAPKEYLEFRSQIMEIDNIEMEYPVVGLLIKTTGSKSELESHGAQVGSQHGNIYSVHLPINKLNDLASLSSVISIEPSIKCQLTLDQSLQDTRADAVHQGNYSITPPVYTGYTGKDVLVVSIDTGIDWDHGDFIDESDGTSRILYLWDQTITGSGGNTPGDFPYGREFTQSDINDEIDGTRTYFINSYDYEGHGTHVMGIMAGDGSATGDAINYPSYTYVGMAPQASIIAVKTNFYESGILDAIQYAFDKAEELNKPVVVNLSLGHHFRAHDGTSLFEQAINNAIDYGRIIVVSAGNEGTDNAHGKYFHAETNIATGTSQTLTIEVPEYTPNSRGGNDFIDLVIWYQGRDNINIELISPNGFSLNVNPGESREYSTSEGRISFDNAEAGPDAENGDNCCRITIWDYYSDRPPASGQWIINFFGNAIMESGHLDAWIGLTQLGDTTASFSPSVASVKELISIPGTAEKVITVAAHSTKTSWVDNEGNFQSIEGALLNDLAFFSSPGPTRDDPGFITGRPKPDISAPGFGIISAYSSRTSYRYDDFRNEDDEHLMLWGTSMSAPHVAGAVALMLDKNPTLAPEEVKSILTSNAVSDEYTGPVPNYSWGSGKLDVYNALDDIFTSELPDITVSPDYFYQDISTDQSAHDNMIVGNIGSDDLYYNLSVGLTTYSPPNNKEDKTAEVEITAEQNERYIDSKSFPGHEAAETASQSFLPFAEASFSEQILLTEGFENDFPPEGWTQIHGDSATRDWYRTSSASVSGRYSAICNWGYDLDEWLITPSLDFSNATSPVLSFWWASSYTYHVSYDRGDLFVKISVDGGLNWDDLWTFGEIGRWDNWTWYQTSLDLSAYQGEPDVIIAFHILADDNADIVLDHIFVTTEPWISVSHSSGQLLPGENENISVEFTARNLFVGTYETNIVVRSNDPDDSEILIPVTLSVTNNQPIITSLPDTVVQVGENYNYQVIAEDADGDNLAFALVMAPDWLTINTQTGLITGTPSDADTGYSRIEIQVSDGVGGVSSQIYNLYVISQGTIISGSINGILTLNNSPYIIEGDITVPNGQTLRIEPGVELRFNGYYQFLVLGNLQAIGTEENRIIFTRHQPTEESRWPGIHLLDADDTTKIVYCNIEFGKGTAGTYSNIGGAIYCEDSNLLLNNSEISNNEASHGGGIYCQDSRALISECIFEHNFASVYGGGLFIVNGRVFIWDNLILKNSAGYGAGINLSDGDHVIANNVVAKNVAENNAGGIYIREGNPVLCNNTIVENQNESSSISGLASYSDETTTLINCIIWNNAGDNLYLSSQGKADMSYCNIPGGYPGTGNINSDPLFIDPTSNNYQLNSGSPCIDSGNPSVIYNDYNGTRNDMGAFGGSYLVANYSSYDFGQIGQGGSSQFNLVLYNMRSTNFIINSLNLSDTVNFKIPVNDYPIAIAPYKKYSLQITYAPQSQGTHMADLTIYSDNFPGAMSSTVKLEGNAFGLAGNINGLWTKNNSPYIINGDVIIPENDSLIIEPGVEIRFNGRYDLTVYGMLKAIGTEADSILFTRYLPTDSLNWAGLRFYRGDNISILKYCIVEYSDGRTSTYGQGGGIYCSSASIILSNSGIRNSRTYSGGGIYAVNSEIVLDHVSIKNNQTGSSGAAIYASRSDFVLNQCIIINNTAGGSGAGFYAQNSAILISNSIILNNISENNGGGIYYREFTSGAILTLNNCIILGNEATDGDGIYVSSGDLKILNSILWNNSDNDIYVSTVYEDSMLVNYTNMMQEVWPGIGNISQEPSFANSAGYDFQLSGGSPCINSGNPHSLFNDIDGSRNDIGMYGGSGLLPEITEYNFGSVDVSVAITANFTLQNFRESTVVIDSLYMHNGIFFQINGSTNLNIPAYGKTIVEVTFDPKINGNFTDSLILQSSDFYGAQEVSINFSGTGIGQLPSLTIQSPNGGEEWPLQSEQNVVWTSFGPIDNVKLEYATDGGSSWDEIIASTPNDGNYFWKIPNNPSKNGLVRISEAITGDPSDVSDGLFTLNDTIPASKVVYLVAIAADSGIVLTWSPATDNIVVNHYQIYCDTINGFLPENAVASSNETHFVHSDPTPGMIYYYRVSAVDSWGNEGEYSDQVWAVITFLKITAPDGAEEWPVGSEHNITWETSVSVGDVKLEYTVNDGSDWNIIDDKSPNNGRYLWKIPETPSRSCRIRVSEASDSNPWDVSDSLFSMSDDSPPSQVVNLTAVATDTSIFLNWSPAMDNIGVDHFQVYCDTTSGFTPTDVILSCTDTFFVHSDVIPGLTYYYRVSAFDFWGNEGEYSKEVGVLISIVENDRQLLIPETYALDQNFPNPFNPVTSIKYKLPEAAHVNIELYNNIGQQVATFVNEHREAGIHVYQFNSNGLASGVYFYSMKTEKFYAMKKLVLLK